MKKYMAFMAWVLVVAMLFAGCGNNVATLSTDEPTSSNEKVDVPIKGGITIDDEPTGNNDVESKPAGDVDATSSVNSIGSANKGNKDKDTDVSNETVTKREYTVKAKGSKYADGIMLPKLSKKEAKITYMTNTTWEYIQQESTDASPTAIYHAMKIWKETYGVDVQIEMVDWGNFTSHLMTSVVAGEGPDVMRWVSGKPKWIINNLVTSLDDKLDLTDKDYDVEKMKESYSLNGKIYAAQSMGLKMPEWVVAYNKTKFENAGETDPMTLYKQGKWNFTQFIKTAKNMTDAVNDEYGIASPGALHSVMFMMMYLNDDGTVTLNINNTKFIKCMQAVWKLYRVENAGRRSDAALSDFPLGKDAMYPIQSKEYCRMMDIAKKNNVKYEFGVVPFPAYDMINEKNPYGSDETYMDAFCISSTPRNLDGAVEFIRLLTKVGSNISRELGDWGWAKNYMDAEEKEVFSKVKYFNWEHEDCTDSIDGAYDTFTNTIKMPVYYNKETDKELSTILAEAKAKLEANIKEYEIAAGLRK